MFIGELREYQAQASRLITTRERALLALDLGTGKTVVSIHAIEQLRAEGKVKCALLIMSSSLTKQWDLRIKEFTDSTAIVIDGSISPKKRSIIFSNIISDPPDYLIIGVRQVISEFQSLQLIKPDLVLVDEVTCIKNFSTQQTKAIKRLKPRFRVGLTAEPIENGKAEELFSIMQWIDPDVLGNWQEFEQNYIVRANGFTVGYKNIPELNARLMEACISKRRDDPDVAEFMPKVEEYNCYVEMDEQTRVLYKTIAGQLLQALRNAGPRAVEELGSYYAGESGRKLRSDPQLGSIGSRLLAASLLLDSPEILRASGRRYNDPADSGGSKYAAQLLESGRVPPEGFLGAKLEAAVELATEYLEEDPEHKVIIFSRFRGMLDLLENGLSKYKVVQFHGGLNGEQRGTAIERFTGNPEVRIFLSSDAGGYGVDLGAASHLINYDLPNSSGVFKQRNGRHVRANSKFRNVYIDTLIVKDSIEEYQLTRLDYKARVGAGVLTGLSDASGKVENTARSLTRFLQDYMENT